MEIFTLPHSNCVKRDLSRISEFTVFLEKSVIGLILNMELYNKIEIMSPKTQCRKREAIDQKLAINPFCHPENFVDPTLGGVSLID